MDERIPVFYAKKGKQGMHTKENLFSPLLNGIQGYIPFFPYFPDFQKVTIIVTF